MKYVKMEYPDGTIHNTIITDYNHSEDKNIDFIDYYDMTEDKKFYSIIKEVDGVLYKDPTIQDYTYDELSKNITKKDMEELPELINNIKQEEKDNSKYELEFDVYNTDTGLYIASSIAEAFHLNKKYRNKKINDIICVPVTEEEVTRIEKISNQGIPSLKHKMINELKIEHQSQAEFVVYHMPETNKYFVLEKVCNEYKVGSGIHYINGTLCREVSYEDIKKIEEESKDKNPCLKANFVELSFGKQTIEVYKNDERNKFYINDDKCNQYNIGTGHHYIDSNLYREVSKQELETLENKKIELNYKSLKFNKLIRQFIVYVDEYANRYFVEDEVAATLGIGKGTHFIGSKKCKEITLKEIKEVTESTKYGSFEYEPKYIYLQFSTDKKIEKNRQEQNNLTDIYKDKNNNNKLYAKKEDCDKYKIGNPDSFKYINNQECYEISLIELTKIKNPVVKTVHLQKEVDFKIVKENNKTFMVCNYENYKFIDEEIAKKYNINYEVSIKVDSKRFVQVEENDIKKIEESSDLTRKEVSIRPTNKNEEINNMLDEKIYEERNENNIKIK